MYRIVYFYFMSLFVVENDFALPQVWNFSQPFLARFQLVNQLLSQLICIFCLLLIVITDLEKDILCLLEICLQILVLFQLGYNIIIEILYQ